MELLCQAPCQDIFGQISCFPSHVGRLKLGEGEGGGDGVCWSRDSPQHPCVCYSRALVAAGEKPAAFPELPSPSASRLLRHMKTSSKSSTFPCCCSSRQARARAAGGHHAEGTGQGPCGAGAGNGVAHWGWRCASMGIKPASSQNLHHPQTQVGCSTFLHEWGDDC